MPNVSATPLLRGDEAAISGYERIIRQLYGHIRFAGISARNEDAADVPIETLFIEPALSEQHQPPEAFDWTESRGALMEPPETQTLTEALLAHRRLVILGDPGTGKSTAIQWIAAALADPVPSVLRQHLRHRGEYTPVPIILRDLPPGVFTADKKAENMWRDLIAAWLAMPVGKWFGSSKDLLDRLIVAGRILFLIDGVDELPSLTARFALRDTLWWAWKKYHDCRWVVTSRLIGFEEANIDMREETIEQLVSYESLDAVAKRSWDGRLHSITRKISSDSHGLPINYGRIEVAHRMYLAPFDDERVKNFSKRWFSRLIALPTEADREARRFYEALAGKTDTRTLGRIPNFLALMALVWRDGLELPDGRARLYQQLSLAYLENIERHRFKDSQRPIAPPLGATAQDMERWLAAVAWHMQLQRHVTEIDSPQKSSEEAQAPPLIVISRTEAEKILSKAIGETTGSKSPASKAGEFLDYAAARSGLLLPRGPGMSAGEDWGFLHLSFQEYFAACYLRDKLSGDRWARTYLYGRGKWEDAETSPEALFNYAGRRMWHETLLFLFELLSLVNPERPGSCLRALLHAEDPTESSWPVLPPAEKVNLLGPLGRTAAMAEWISAVAVDLHVSFDAIDRFALIRRCWEWEIEWPDHQDNWLGDGAARLSAFLCARPTATELALPPLVKLFADRGPKRLRLRGIRGADSLPAELFHQGLERIAIGSCPDLTHLPEWPRMSHVRSLSIWNCQALSALPTKLDLPALTFLELERCSALEQLPDLSHLPMLQTLRLANCNGLTSLPDLTILPRLTSLSLENCNALPPNIVNELVRQLPRCKIHFR